MKIHYPISKFLGLCGLLILSHRALSQDTATTAGVAAAIQTARQHYNNSFDVNPQLYTGPEYLDYARQFHTPTGHQFFLSAEKQNGAVYYNHHYFPGLKLLYDVVLDQLVLPHASIPLSFRLINENVQGFTLDDHRFIRLSADSAASSVITPGYYEVLVESPAVQLLARRAKQMLQKVDQGSVVTEFVSLDKLFIRRAGTYYPVSSKSAVTRLFADRGSEVQQYIQDHKLKFKKASREADIVQLTRYYGSLAPQ